MLTHIQGTLLCVTNCTSIHITVTVYNVKRNRPCDKYTHARCVNTIIFKRRILIVFVTIKDTWYVWQYTQLLHFFVLIVRVPVYKLQYGKVYITYVICTTRCLRAGEISYTLTTLHTPFRSAVPPITCNQNKTMYRTQVTYGETGENKRFKILHASLYVYTTVYTRYQ